MQELTLQPIDEATMTAASEGGAAAPQPDGAIVQMFRRAARLTAQTLLLETDGLTANNPNYQSEMEQEQSVANQELSEGDARALADEEEAAIQHYRSAWLHASSAKLHALRSR